MTIKTGLGTNPINIGTSATVILDSTLSTGFNKRFEVTAMNVKNNSLGDVIVAFFSSPDLTIANGILVANVKIAATKELDVNPIIGMGYTLGQNIIAISDVELAEVSTTYTTYDKTDA